MQKGEIISIRSPFLENMNVGDDLRSILQAAFERVDPINAVIHAINSNPMFSEFKFDERNARNFSHLFIWAMGKAAQTMSFGLKKALPGKITRGVTITKHNDPALEKYLLPEIISFEGDHPVPSRRSAQATRSALSVLGRLEPQDTVVCLVSGGGSALAIYPEEGITIRDYQQLTRLLLECGATIQEINTIRQQVDRIKGGGLARLLQPARVISLILSDVVGDPLDVIASGPTIPSHHTMVDADRIVRKYALEDKLPIHVQLLFQRRMTQFANQDHLDKKVGADIILIGNNLLASQAAKKQAQQLGFATQIVTSTLQGEAREVGKRLAMHLKAAKRRAGGEKHCWIYGGETTVTIRGKGKGGRNQELALAAALELQGCQNVCLLSIATDGEDGPTDAAGAIVDGNTITNGVVLGLDACHFLAQNDAYTYFEKIGGLIKTGPSGTNVNDLVFLFSL